MLQNPASGGMPASDSAPTTQVKVVHGILRHRPPISRTSWVCVPWITLPAARKSSALKKAWVMRWKTAAVQLPTPSASIISPSWEMVE